MQYLLIAKNNGVGEICEIWRYRVGRTYIVSAIGAILF